MNKNLKRRLYAIALAGVLLTTPKITAYADEADMTPIDIDSAISDLVPGYSDSNNNNNNYNYTKNNSSNSEECKHVYPSVADDVINQVTPSCTTGGSYDEVYYCIKCGANQIKHFEISAPGHKWGEPKIENETSTGYDSVRECTNKGCHEKITTHVDIITPTEPSIPTTPTEPGVNPKTGDNTNLSLALATFIASDLGLISLTGYSLYENIREILEQTDNQKNKGGKYLRKTK
ncbi:MAG: hypothetical protein J6K23_02560 [Bacilli bacterium]|nr:hypothetical protein [Bacilli bacterium]